MVVRYLERGIKAVDAQKLSAPITKNPDKSFIIQVHGRNLEVADALIDSGVGCSVLFDGSGGRGIQPTRWPLGRSEFTACGYAGGLGPNNIREQAGLIQLSAVGPARNWWMDMESSLCRSGTKRKSNVLLAGLNLVGPQGANLLLLLAI